MTTFPFRLLELVVPGGCGSEMTSTSWARMLDALQRHRRDRSLFYT
jgi:hypothetical protein